MDAEAMKDRKNRILMGIYSSSWSTSMIALTIVGLLEIFMLVYTLVNPPLFGIYIGIYRIFYIALLTVAIVYIVLNILVKRDIKRRFVWLNIANPLYAAFFYAWSLGITHFDAVKYGVVDPAVFMTFSLTVPLSFFLFPSVYTIIVAVVDALMLYITAVISGSLGQLINLSIFFIFQLVLGISFLRLKMKLAERIVREQENAEIDVLTGFPNRRAYEREIARRSAEPVQEDLVYIAIDMNDLKEVNDSHGHEAGDRLIIGAARCIEQCFGNGGSMFRIGGDEFAVLICVGRAELEGLLRDYEKRMEAWSEQNGMELSTAFGYACQADYRDCGVTELARVADKRMYEEKARYYQRSGKERRRYLSDVS